MTMLSLPKRIGIASLLKNEPLTLHRSENWPSPRSRLDSGSSCPYLAKNDGGLPWMGCPLLVSYLARWSFSCILGHLHGSSNNQRTQKYAPSLSLLLLHFHVLRAHWFPAQGPRPVLNLLYSWVYLCPIMQFHFNRKRQYLHGPIGI